jgi:hypothetical protein
VALTSPDRATPVEKINGLSQESEECSAGAAARGARMLSGAVVMSGQIPANPGSGDRYTAYRKNPSAAATTARYPRASQLSTAGSSRARILCRRGRAERALSVPSCSEGSEMGGRGSRASAGAADVA